MYISIPLASHFLTASILSLILPLGVVIIVALWYGLLWRRGHGER
jgi:hypothetical protein